MTCLSDSASVTTVIAALRSYAMTLRRTLLTKGSPDRTDYINHLSKLSAHGMYLHTYEFEEAEGLHLHGVVSLPEGFNMKRLRYRGWHLHLEEIFDSQGWKTYIEKEKFKDYIELSITEGNRKP